jgi:hypothetical protein
MKHLIKFTLIWISQNMAIPFWMVGHVHLMNTVYEDIHELIASVGMNVIVGIGFYLDYKQSNPFFARPQPLI